MFFWATELILQLPWACGGEGLPLSYPCEPSSVGGKEELKHAFVFVQKPLKSKISRGGSVLNSLTVCFSSQMKAVKISVN